MKTRRLLAGQMLLILLVAGCQSSNPASPSDSLAGTWSGVITDEISGAGTIRFDLMAGPGGGVNGTWTSTFANAANNNSGTLSAIVPLGPPLALGLSCTSTGSALFTMTVDGGRMSGTYSGVGCQGLERGTASLTKQ